MDIDEFKKISPNYKLPYYTHFDTRIKLLPAFNYVQSSQNITHHAFYPFIEFTVKHYKYTYNDKGEKTRQLKVRKLHYAAHIDSLIFKYYSITLSRAYEALLKKYKLSKNILAYRTDLPKQCNIHFAKYAFDFLKSQEKAYVLVADFKDFFPSLNHAYLKQQLIKTLNTPVLADDWYSIFKNLTKYASVKRETLLSINKLNNTSKDLIKLNRLKQALPTHLTINKAKALFPNFIEKNRNPYGIPQGTSISGILANIYMLEFDKQIQQLAHDSQGLYLRYCDDIILILPNKIDFNLQDSYYKFKQIVSTIPNLHIEENKTNIFSYTPTTLHNISNAFHKNQKRYINNISYLGFTFNGQEISICDKTINKYYNRMYKKASNITNAKLAGKKRSCKNLYLRYSAHHNKISMIHARIKYTSNFLDYAKRSAGIFKNEKAIEQIIKKHLHKIRHALKHT